MSLQISNEAMALEGRVMLPLKRTIATFTDTELDHPVIWVCSQVCNVSCISTSDLHKYQCDNLKKYS